MNWKKLGRIFTAEQGPEWMHSHASHPIPEHVRDDRYRIYFASRNERNMSQIGSIEIDLADPTTVQSVSEEPVLELGPLGRFDDSGVFPSAIVEVDGKKYLYFIGFRPDGRVLYDSAIGVAVSETGGETFEKYSPAPILDRSRVDPYMTLMAEVRYEDDTWRMWYGSATKVVTEGEEPGYPHYHIKYAESDDGINWRRNDIVCIDHEHENEARITRPTVIHDGDHYQMWYCYAFGSDDYLIGYAESSDGVDWERRDDVVGIETSNAGWDAKMIGYPYVFTHNDETYMLYTGNEYGQSGFGIASLNP